MGRERERGRWCELLQHFEEFSELSKLPTLRQNNSNATRGALCVF